MLPWVERLSLVLGDPDSGAVDPESMESVALLESFSTVNSWPISGRQNQALFDTLGQEIAQPLDLDRRVIIDDGVVVSPFPHGASPLIELANLDREVPIKVAHKLCHDPSGREGTQEVVVV